MDPLPEDAIIEALAGLPAWSRSEDGRSIRRGVRFADFATAFGFMSAVALEAQALDHHPDWSNSWATVEIVLTTHAAGGLTDLDVDLAKRINRHAAAAGARPAETGPAPGDCR